MGGLWRDGGVLNPVGDSCIAMQYELTLLYLY